MSGKKIRGLLDKPFAKIIFQYLFDYSNSQIFLNGERELTNYEYYRFCKIQEDISKGIPLQYAIGKWNFYGRDFIINENVLIPRPETELLVDEILKLDLEDKSILDIGTGSGAIAITLSLESKASIYASDISQKALEMAKQNAENFGVNIEFYLSDVFNEIPKDKKIDIIVSNPPYLTEDEYLEIDKLLYHEPKNALVAGDKGYEIYERIIEEARDRLNENGLLFFEIGFEQGDIIKELLIKNGYKNIQIKKDYGNKDRIVIASLN